MEEKENCVYKAHFTLYIGEIVSGRIVVVNSRRRCCCFYSIFVFVVVACCLLRHRTSTYFLFASSFALYFIFIYFNVYVFRYYYCAITLFLSLLCSMHIVCACVWSYVTHLTFIMCIVSISHHVIHIIGHNRILNMKETN